MKKIIALLLLVSASAACLGATAERLRLQKITREFIAEHGQEEHFTALSISIRSPNYHKPINIYAGTMGDLHQKAINSKSLFQVGSINKSFVTAILLKLEENPDMHFSIDDSITRYFPEFNRWNQVTIKELMNMSSGIPDFFTDENILKDYASSPYRHYNQYAWVKNMYDRPLLFTPGSKFDYSNTNYFILGLLIEKLTKRPLAYVIKKEITDPLHLANTYYVEHQPDPNLLSSLVHGYQNQAEFTQYIPRDSDVTRYSLSYVGAAGALLSTTKDISKWTNKLFTPGMVLSTTQFKKLTTLISQSTGNPVKQTSLNDPNAYGLGIGAIYDSQLHTSVYIYQGITFGCRTIYLYLPKEQTSIVIAANSSYSLDKNHLVNLINNIKQTVIHY